jgi:two-component system response regulator TctD
LPDANGLDLVEKIRKQGDQVPVLVISAFTFGDDEARAINVGADAYLRKPYHFDEFKNALDDLGIPVSKLLH